MVKLYDKGAYLVDGIHIVSEEEGAVQNLNGKELRKKTPAREPFAYSILRVPIILLVIWTNCRLNFDAMTSHDITFVGIHTDGESIRNGKISNSLCSYQPHNSLVQ